MQSCMRGARQIDEACRFRSNPVIETDIIPAQLDILMQLLKIAGENLFVREEPDGQRMWAIVFGCATISNLHDVRVVGWGHEG
jgi:hypothetical protein